MELPRTSFRESISTDNLDNIIFAYELLSQPDPSLLNRIPHITHRNQAVVSLARENDLIFLNQPIDKQYLQWLRNFGLGTDKIYEFESNGKTPLPELIKKEDQNLLDQILGEGKRIYVPRISTKAESEAATYLNANLFGAAEDLLLKYYNKGKFKKKCENVDVPVIPYRFLENQTGLQSKEITNAVKELFVDNDKILLKKTTSSSGAGIIELTTSNLEEITYKLEGEKISEVLLEKKIDVQKEYSSQWSIGLNGQVYFIGLCESHTSKGSFTGNSYMVSPSQSKKLLEYSLRIVNKMAEEGYIGNTQLDFLETKQGEILCCENNTRLTGSSCAWEIYNQLKARHKDIYTFISTKFSIPKPTSFNIIREISQDLLYNGKKESCFFPYDIGALSIDGQFMGIITAPEIGHAKKILHNLEERGIKAKTNYKDIK